MIVSDTANTNSGMQFSSSGYIPVTLNPDTEFALVAAFPQSFPKSSPNCIQVILRFLLATNQKLHSCNQGL
jgi:hypothetical protein